MPKSTPEIFKTGYHPLFAVQLLHRYFLNVGLTEFDDDPDAPAVQAARRAYDVSQWLRIEPSPATWELLRNQRLLFRPTPEGFCVLAAGEFNSDKKELSPAIALPPAAHFTFLAYATDPSLLLYTTSEEDEDADLLPNAKYPAGQVRVFTNAGVEGTLRTGIMLWHAGTPRPFAVVDIVHRADTAQNLLQPAGLGGWQFRHVMNNRHTTWEYQGLQPGYRNKQFGPYPLVRHGRIDLTAEIPFAVANPTAATTIARPDGYYSLIY